jgi:hypothetical protein
LVIEDQRALLSSDFESIDGWEGLVTKPWHTSPSRDPRSSTLYPFVPWSVVQELHPGIETAKATRLITVLQRYHHPVNAIAYSSYAGQEIEVALKLSADGQTVEDVSFKKRGQISEQDGAANGSQPIRSETNRTSSAAGSRR